MKAVVKLYTNRAMTEAELGRKPTFADLDFEENLAVFNIAGRSSNDIENKVMRVFNNMFREKRNSLVAWEVKFNAKLPSVGKLTVSKNAIKGSYSSNDNAFEDFNTKKFEKA